MLWYTMGIPWMAISKPNVAQNFAYRFMAIRQKLQR
jgi:hypothetical protein